MNIRIGNYYIHYYKNVFAHKCYYDSNATSTSTFSASMFRVHECECIIKFYLGKWRPIRDQIFVVVETVFFHSICSSVFDKLIWRTIGPKSFLFGTAQFSLWASGAVNYDYIVSNSINS